MDTEGTWNEPGSSSFEGEGQNLKQKAHKGADRARGQVRSVADSRRTELASHLGGIGRALRGAGDKLREEENETASHYTDMLADRADQASRFLDEHDASEIYGEVENVARKSPLLFLGGCLAVGFAVGRFLKASPSEGSREQMPLGVTGPGYERTPGRYESGQERYESGQERYETAPERDLTAPAATPVVTTEVIELESSGPGYVQPVIGTKRQDGESGER